MKLLHRIGLVALLAFGLALAPLAQATIAVIQSPAVSFNNGVTTLTVSLSALTNGSMIVAAVTDESASTTITVADTANGSLTADVTGDAGAFAYPKSVIFHIQNTSTSTDTVTATFSTAANGKSLKVWEVSGAATSSVVDATGSLVDNGGSQTSLPITTVTAHDAIFVAVAGYPSGYVVDTGFTASFSQQSYSYVAWGEYVLDGGSAQSYSLTFGGTQLPVGSYGGAAVAYKVAGGGGTSVPSRFFLARRAEAPDNDR